MKAKNSRLRIGLLTGWALLMLAVAFNSYAKSESCFANIHYATPLKQDVQRALYILIDETIPLSDAMKKKVEHLLMSWGKPGDMVKIARFSASYRNLYPELVYEKYIEPMPDDKFMFNLHYKDKKQVLHCLEQQKTIFRESFDKHLKAALKNINPKIPKSELLGSLKLLSKQLVLPDLANEKVVLLISDGIENSSVTSFYSRGVLKNINPRKTISSLRKKGMMGFFKNTRVYIYGLGLLPDKKKYVDPKRIENLKRFWERYIVESGGKVEEIGTPELLLTSVE